ncbi:MAG: phenylacetate--CoA ligase family protein [Patiriisocius sp.]|uniref:phenylacetate--CoA ligase family protein n=1 Tax=Patiriisocius sp. TaxID=2822396 RepID=UPI003EF89923
MLDKIYEYSPHFLKSFMLNVKAYLNSNTRYTQNFERYLEKYIQLWKSPVLDIKKFQKEELISLLLDCKSNVPLYKERFIEAKISDIDITSDPYNVLKKMPFLSKKDRKQKVELLINQNPNRPLKVIDYTSGTSGTPTKNYLDSESIEKGFALWSRFHHTIGITRKERTVRFSGKLIVKPHNKNPPFWVHNRIDNQLFMSSYHLTEKNIDVYIQKLNKFKPTFIDGYPSAIYIIAKQINKKKQILLFTPKAIATTAETLYDYQRVEIEKAFGSKVFNQYASSEGSPFITECINGNLHINEDSGVFEFLTPKDILAGPGEIGRMVVTSFRNSKTPLIRYDIEDTVLLPEIGKVCNCGCNMPMVEKIIGREDDLLWTEEKGYVGRMDTAYKGLEGILLSQIIQEDPVHFIVNNVVDDEFTIAMEEKFIKNLKDRLGKDIILNMRKVKDIPLGASGKFNAVKRNFEVKK